MKNAGRGEPAMIRYQFSVSLSDQAPITEPIRQLMAAAAVEATARSAAARKDRTFTVSDQLIDETHIHVEMAGLTPIPSPTRSLSALSRSMLYLDKDNLLNAHIIRGCVVKATLLSVTDEAAMSISDLDMITTVLQMVYGGSSSYREKALAKQYVEKIRQVVLEYLRKKRPSPPGDMPL